MEVSLNTNIPTENTDHPTDFQTYTHNKTAPVLFCVYVNDM